MEGHEEDDGGGKPERPGILVAGGDDAEGEEGDVHQNHLGVLGIHQLVGAGDGLEEFPDCGEAEECVDGGDKAI